MILRPIKTELTVTFFFHNRPKDMSYRADKYRPSVCGCGTNTGAPYGFGWENVPCSHETWRHMPGVLRKRQLLHPAPPYYPFPRGNFHTRGNIRGFTVG